MNQNGFVFKYLCNSASQLCRQVGIPAERQRLIFCGRVLGDEKRLTEYEVLSHIIVNY